VLAPLLRPKFWPGHLAMLVCLAIAGGLGLWQLSAWHQHRVAAERDLVNQPAKPLAEVMTGDSPFPGDAVGQPVSFSGRWIGDNLYVADREQAGRRGYWVVTALVVDGSRSAMPVVRGWAARADVPAPTGTASVTGWLQASEGNDAIDTDPHDDVIPTMRIASLVEHVPADLYSGYVVARTVSDQQGLVHVDPPSTPGVSAFTGLRNLFYAVEWWVFGGFAVFIWVRWCRDSLRPVEESVEEEPEPSDA
jgi:cytochrome oxidase assembly protein ShyY1